MPQHTIRITRYKDECGYHEYVSFQALYTQGQYTYFRIDEQYLHFSGELLIYCELTIQLLLRLRMPTLQGLHGDQEEQVGGRQAIISIIGKVCVPK